MWGKLQLSFGMEVWVGVQMTQVLEIATYRGAAVTKFNHLTNVVLKFPGRIQARLVTSVVGFGFQIFQSRRKGARPDDRSSALSYRGISTRKQPSCGTAADESHLSTGASSKPDAG